MFKSKAEQNVLHEHEMEPKRFELQKLQNESKTWLKSDGATSKLNLKLQLVQEVSMVCHHKL